MHGGRETPTLLTLRTRRQRERTVENTRLSLATGASAPASFLNTALSSSAEFSLIPLGTICLPERQFPPVGARYL